MTASDEAAKRPHQYVPPDWPLPMRALGRLSQWLAILEGIGIAFCLLAVVFLATWQFVERNLTFRHIWFFPVPKWTDGVIRHSIFMLGFFGGAYAAYTNRHIRIDAVTRSLKPRRRMGLRILTTLGALFIVTLFVYAAWGFYGVTLEEQGEASHVGQIFTPARGALVIVFGYAIIAFHFLVQILLDIGWLLSKKPPPAEWVAESAHGEAPPPAPEPAATTEPAP